MYRQISFFPCFIPTMNRHSCFCAVNNHGAFLVQDGCYREAIAVLTVGLKQVREEMAIRALSMNPTAGCCCRGKSNSATTAPQATWALGQRSISAQCDLFGRSSSSSSSLNTQDMSTSNATILEYPKEALHDDHHLCHQCDEMEQEPYLFSSPMFLHTSRHVGLATISFMMIFNMALSYDLISKSESDELSGMRTALRLYELAYKVQDGDGTLEVPMLYLCGLLNNMARLYTHFQNHESSGWCLSYLLGILMYYKTESEKMGNTTKGINKMESYYLSQFLRSTSTIVLRNPGTAGAA